MNIERNGTSQVGASLQLVCQVGNTPTHPIGAVVYEWTSTCSGGCFVLGQSRAATVGTQYLKAVDSGTHTCTVTDGVGNRGSSSVNITQLVSVLIVFVSFHAVYKDHYVMFPIIIAVNLIVHLHRP